MSEVSYPIVYPTVFSCQVYAFSALTLLVEWLTGRASGL